MPENPDSTLLTFDELLPTLNAIPALATYTLFWALDGSLSLVAWKAPCFLVEDFTLDPRTLPGILAGRMPQIIHSSYRLVVFRFTAPPLPHQELGELHPEEIPDDWHLPIPNLPPQSPAGEQ